jgi:aspartate/methionine/tyrosine aminotransferase
MDFHKDKAYNTVLDKTANIFRKQGFENSPGFVDLSFSEPVAKHYLAHDFIHQTVAAIVNPKLLNSNEIMGQAKERAMKYLSMPGFNVGAYSESRGTPFLRKNIVKFIEKRDGLKVDIDNIFLANGAANSYDHIIQLIFDKGEKVRIILIIDISSQPLSSNISQFSYIT